MGIKGLTKLINDIVNNDLFMKKYKLSDISGWKISIDTSLLIYLSIIALRKSGKDMKNDKGQITSHLQTIFYKIISFLEYNIVPIFVFDGKPSINKNKTIKKRKKIKEEALKKLEDYEDSEDENYIKNFKKSYSISKNEIDETKILLDLMGIPYIVAPGEADIVCSWLATRYDNNGEKYVDAVCSNDTDMLVLGSPILLKNMIMSSLKDFNIIKLDKILVKMNLTMNQFVDLCILLGTDYCDNIKGIGPKSAYKLIQKYESLENVINFLKNKYPNKDILNDEFIKCMYNTKKYYINSLNELDNSKSFILTNDNLEMKKFKKKELIDFMCVKHNFDYIKINNAIKKMEKIYEKFTTLKENNTNYKMINNGTFQNLDNITFLSDDENNEDFPSKKNNKTNLINYKKYTIS